MIEKRLSAKPGKVLVTFRISQDVWADHITLVGDFNDWNEASHPLIQTRSDPDWHITIELDTGRCYQFRYLCDGQEWGDYRGLRAFPHSLHLAGGGITPGAAGGSKRSLGGAGQFGLA